MSLFLQALVEHRQLFGMLDQLDASVNHVARLLATSLAGGGKIMFCGNGGSASDSQHLAAELTGRFVSDRRPLAAIALSTDSSQLTCIGNDFGFDDVFVRPVQALARRGDCLVGISTSGNSENVFRAMGSAREMGVTTIGLLGRDGGRILSVCDAAVVVPSMVTARIQEAHIMIGHVLCAEIEEQLNVATHSQPVSHST